MVANEHVGLGDLQGIHAQMQWYKKNNRWQNVTISEIHVPPDEDMGVVYEVVFEPAELDAARLEFWFTETGGVAVKIETRERIGRRLCRKFHASNNFASSSLMFHQPTSVTQRYLENWINLCAAGRVLLQIQVGWFGIRDARVALTHSDGEMLFGEVHNPRLLRNFRSADKGLPLGAWFQLPFRPWQ